MTNKTVLSDKEIEAGREEIFSTNNPFCPCDARTMRKVARWVEQAVLQSPEIQQLRKDADDLRWLKEKGLFSSPKAKQWSTIRIVYRDPFEANDLTEAIQEVRRQRPEMGQKP